MSQNHSDQESEFFSDMNITKSFKTYSRPKKQMSPSKGTNKQQKLEKADVPQQKKLPQSMQRRFLNNDTSVILHDVSSLSLKLNGYGTQIKKNFKSVNRKSTENNGTIEFGKDWDEMEFLSTKSNCTKSVNQDPPVTVSKNVCNGEYARTRKNLVKKVGYDTDPGKNKNIEEKSCASLNSNSSEIFSISSIISKSPTKVLTLGKKDFGKTNSSPSEPKTLSLMDMVRKYSLNPNSISLSISNPKEKEQTKKEVKSSNDSLHLSVNEAPCPSPRKRSVTKQNRSLSPMKSPNSNLKINSPVLLTSTPLECQKEGILPQRRNGIKTPKEQFKNIRRRGKKNSQQCKETEISISNVHSQSIASDENENNRTPYSKFNKSSFKRFPGVLDKISKKIKTSENSFEMNNNVEENNLLNANNNSFSSVHEAEVSPAEISNFLDAEIEKTSTEVLKKNNIVSLIPPVLPQTTNVNSVPSTALIPSVPLSNTFTNAFVTSDNNLVYSINPYVPAYQPTLPNSQSTIFVLPVPCLSCNNVPQQQNSNNSQPAQPFYQVNCTGQNVESCVRNIMKSYYPQSQLNVGNPTHNNSFLINSNTRNSLNTVNLLNGNISINKTTSSAPLFDISSNFRNSSELCKDLLVESDSESDARSRLVTIDRSTSLLCHFYELMEKQSKLSLIHCKEQAKEMFDTLFSKELSVEAFCMCPDVPEFFSNFCFKDSNRKQTNYKFDQYFKNSSLVDVVKKYISEHVKTILKNLSPNPLLKLEEVLKTNNSNLTLSEKLLMKKIFGASKEICLRDLIGALFFVGIITVFKEYKEIHQKQGD